MADDTSTEGRALLTETERKAIAGERSDSYRYKTKSYLKRRIEKLETDVEVLEKHAPELLAEIQDAVNVADEQSRQDPTPDETDRSEQQDTTQLAQDLLAEIQNKQMLPITGHNRIRHLTRQTGRNDHTQRNCQQHRRLSRPTVLRPRPTARYATRCDVILRPTRDPDVVPPGKH